VLLSVRVFDLDTVADLFRDQDVTVDSSPSFTLWAFHLQDVDRTHVLQTAEDP